MIKACEYADARCVPPTARSARAGRWRDSSSKAYWSAAAPLAQPALLTLGGIGVRMKGLFPDVFSKIQMLLSPDPPMGCGHPAPAFCVNFEIQKRLRMTTITLGIPREFSENFEKLVEIANKIEHHSFQSWLFFHYAKQQLELLKKDDKSFKQGLQEYAKDDWPLLLDRLHIPQDAIKQKLSGFLSTIWNTCLKLVLMV